MEKESRHEFMTEVRFQPETFFLVCLSDRPLKCIDSSEWVFPDGQNMFRKAITILKNGTGLRKRP